jgi:hypothetical protein
MTLTEDQQQAVQRAIYPLEQFQRDRFMAALEILFAGRIGDGELFRMLRDLRSAFTTHDAAGVYSGRPMEKHLPLPVDARHFDRRLGLASGAADEGKFLAAVGPR